MRMSKIHCRYDPVCMHEVLWGIGQKHKVEPYWAMVASVEFEDPASLIHLRPTQTHSTLLLYYGADLRLDNLIHVSNLCILCLHNHVTINAHIHITMNWWIHYILVPVDCQLHVKLAVGCAARISVTYGCPTVWTRCVHVPSCCPSSRLSHS